MSKFAPMERGTTEELAIKRYLLEDFGAFFSYFSGLNMADFQPVVFEAMATVNRLVLFLPGTCGKSTSTKWYVIWRICQNPNWRGIIGMKTDSEVKMYARSIRKELAGNHKLIEFFGPFVPRGKDARWSDDSIEVHYRQITESQPTLEFTSSRSVEQVLGHRCDEYIFDDVVTPTTTNTIEQRDKQEAQFNTGINTGPQHLWDRNPAWTDENSEPFFLNKPEHVYWPTDINLRPYGKPYILKKGIIAGTSFDPDDLLHRKGCEPQDLIPGKLYKGNAEGFNVLYYDCWQHDEKNELTDTPLFHSRWTKAELELLEKQIGSIDFNKRMRNIAIDESMTVFKKKWIRGDSDFPGCLDYERSWGTFPYGQIEGRDAKWLVGCGMDPSTGRRGENASWSAFVVLAMDTEVPEPRPRYVIDIYRNQMGFQDILSTMLDGGMDAKGNRIEGLWNEYRYNVGVIEENACQKWLLSDPRRIKFSLEHSDVKVVGHNTQAGNKWNPQAGVASMQSLIQDGLLKIPYKTPADREKSREFINQLSIYPEGICDYAMSLWFAYLGIKGQDSRLRYFNNGPGRKLTRN